MSGVNGVSATTSSDLVHITFQVKGQAKENIKLTTSKGYELVEANGFRMIRKRKAVDMATVEAAPQASKDGSASLVVADACTADKESVIISELGSISDVPQQLQSIPEVVVVEEQQEDAEEEQDQAMQHVPAVSAPALQAMQSVPAVTCSADQILQALPSACPQYLKMQFVLSSLLSSAAAQQDGAHGMCGLAPWRAAAAQSVAAAFSRKLEASVDGSCSLLLEGAEGGPQLEALPPMLRDATHSGMLKAGLQQKLEALQQEEVHWRQLQANYKVLRSEPEQPSVSVPCDATGSMQGGAQSGSQQQQQQQQQSTGGTESAEAATAVTATVHVEVVEGAGAAAQVREGAAAASAAVAEVTGAAGRSEGAAAAKEESQEVPTEAGRAVVRSALQATREEVHDKIALQVESLCSVLSKVDCVIASGEQACTILQADYHQDKFKTFPHVNSPAWLIRKIASQHVAVYEDSGMAGFGTPV